MTTTTIERIARRLAVGAAAASVVVPLSLQTPAHADARGCASNVCMSLVSQGGGIGGDVSVAGWAYASTFSGYFTVNGPQGYVATSPTDTWNGGDGSDYWAVLVRAAPAGTYCVTGTDSAGGNMGTACNAVG